MGIGACKIHTLTATPARSNGIMKLDDDVCLCCHVSLRKLINFARRERPRVDSQMSECLGAGTGCGWCIPTLCKIASAARDGTEIRIETTPDEYAQSRTQYRTKREPRNEFERRS